MGFIYRCGVSMRTPTDLPIEFEKDVIRRNVPWLTADPISSINFTPIHALDGTITPQGCAFERHHSGAIELRKEDYPADDQRPGRYAAGLYL